MLAGRLLVLICLPDPALTSAYLLSLLLPFTLLPVLIAPISLALLTHLSDLIGAWQRETVLLTDRKSVV